MSIESKYRSIGRTATIPTSPSFVSLNDSTMTTQTMNAHKEIPGNPSTAKSSQLRLNDRSNGEPLRLLSEKDWDFWITNGYVIIKNAVPKEQVKKLAAYLWEYEEKTRKTSTPGIKNQ